MNYRNAALAEINTLAEECPDLSVGQVILAVVKRAPKEVNTLEWLLTISDEDIYTEIEAAKLKERDKWKA